MSAVTTQAIARWIRPWYPGEVRMDTGLLMGHLDPACPDLLAVRPEVVEGSGWLDPFAGDICSPCLLAHDPKMHAERFGGGAP